MSDRPTPETERLFYANGHPMVVVHADAVDFCERLERERDEARQFEAEDAATLNAVCKITEQLRQELDEARENAKFWGDSSIFWRGECMEDMREIARLTAIIKANGLGGEL